MFRNPWADKYEAEITLFVLIPLLLLLVVGVTLSNIVFFTIMTMVARKFVYLEITKPIPAKDIRKGFGT